MNKLIIILAAALTIGTAAFAAEPAELTVRERKDAERCGIAVEQWKTMTKKARKEAKQEAKAKDAAKAEWRAGHDAYGRTARRR